MKYKYRPKKQWYQTPMLPALLSGALLVFAFPRYDHGWLAFVALVPLLMALTGRSRAEGFLLGLASGAVYFFGTMYWVYYSIHHFGGLPLGVGIAAAVMLAAILALYIGAFGSLMAWALAETTLPASILAPLFWVVLEYLRGILFTGFPWNLLGYTQHNFLALIQISDLTGVYGVSFLVVGVNGALADLFILQKRRELRPLFSMMPTIIGYGIIIIAVLGSLGYGAYRLHQTRIDRPFKVSIVQPNIPQNMKWDENYKNDTIALYYSLTMRAAAQEPDLIIWPETAMPYVFSREAYRKSDLLGYQAWHGVPIASGLMDSRVDDTGQFYTNGLALMDEGKVSFYYDKMHLVPFGEYVPLRKVLFFIDRLVPGSGEYRPGRRYMRATVRGFEFSPLICYEVIFPNQVRKFFQKGEALQTIKGKDKWVEQQGGDFIVNVTNDAWFGTTAGPYQHWAMAKFRAVENRKPLIRAANSGISGIIDSSGRVMRASQMETQDIITDTFHTDKTRTLYTRYGDLFVYLCIVFSIIIIAEMLSDKNKKWH